MIKAQLARSLMLSLQLGLISLLAIAPAHASDNSNSTLLLFELLAAAGSQPIDAVPPPIIIKPKPPSLQVLQQQVFADLHTDEEQQAALNADAGELQFWQTEDPEVAQINVPLWTQAVTSDKHTIATVEAQIAQLDAQIAAITAAN
jgi:hypothetical protein